MKLLTQYKVTLKDFADGELLLLTYKGNELASVEQIEYFNRLAWDHQKDIFLPKTLEALEKYKELFKAKVTFTEVRVPAITEKIAQWKEAWRVAFGTEYNVTTREGKMLSAVEVSPELLKAYFIDIKEWWNNTKNVGNYVKNINNITAAVRGNGGAGAAEAGAGSRGKKQAGELAKSALEKRFKRRS